MGGKRKAPYLAAANFLTPPAVILASSISAIGCKGTSLLDVHRTNSDERAMRYQTQGNWITGTNIFTVRYSFVPNWSGNPPVDQNLFFIGNDANAYFGGMKIVLFDNGLLNVGMKTGDGVGSNMITGGTTAGTLTFVNKTKKEIQVSCDGTRVYASVDGVAVGDWALATTDRYMSNVHAGHMIVGPYSVDTYLDELLIFDTCEAQVYTPSADYYPCADFDGTLSVGAGAGNILSGVSETINGVVVSGTAVAAAAATTKIGVAANDGTGTYDGTDRHTHPTAGQVSNGVQFKNNSLTNNVTGTLDSVTNMMENATLYGQDNEAILVEGE